MIDSVSELVNETNILELKPISYIVSGKLGDFIHLLSIICEKFNETGKKGILYMSQKSESYATGLNDTFESVRQIVMKQPYIHDLKIHNNEPYDIDLDAWRLSNNRFKINWYYLFNEIYNVKWGINKWLTTNIPYDDKWKNKIVINTTDTRFPDRNIDFKLLQKLFPDDLVYIAASKSQYMLFEHNTNCSIEYFEFKTFDELVAIINSCKLFIGSASTPLSLAYALHKPNITCLTDTEYFRDNIYFFGIEEFIPNTYFNINEVRFL